MAVSYTQTLSIDMIMTEIEALLDWRNQVIRQCIFPGSAIRPADTQAPSALLMWCKRGAESGAIDRKVVDRMVLVYEELCKAARQIIDFSAGGTMPTIEVYDSFVNQFEAFVVQIRRLHQDISDAGMAVDAVTGLRTVSGMKSDLKREQDRFDRKGTPFSIANIEVDNMAELQQQQDRRGLDSVYATIAQVIARTIRSFDDAYFLGKGEFLLILKHVEFMDACSVMDRLRAEIDTTPVFLAGGAKIKITASFGISEAIQRESPDIALQHAKSALLRAKEAGGNRVTEYRETSALEQYAKDVHGK
jgi:diguanylate cyclase (GGDEF)-like protein